MICSKCHLICKDHCPICGHRKTLREIERNEPVLLITLTAMQAMFVESVLGDSGIPYSRKGIVGGALTAEVGIMREIYRFYVPYAAINKARDAIESVFVEDEQIMRALHEFDIGE